MKQTSPKRKEVSATSAVERLRECLVLHRAGEKLSGYRVSHLEVPADALQAMLDAAEKLACSVRRACAEQLPNTWFTHRDVAVEESAASVDTLPKGQDAQQGLAGTESGAVGEAETPKGGPA